MTNLLNYEEETKIEETKQEGKFFALILEKKYVKFLKIMT